jgi:hypothetical protein
MRDSPGKTQEPVSRVRVRLGLQTPNPHPPPPVTPTRDIPYLLVEPPVELVAPSCFVELEQLGLEAMNSI